MGTSSLQRSPATPEWERVRELYRAGVRDPARIASRIAHALGPDVRAHMSAPGVVLCMDTLLRSAVPGYSPPNLAGLPLTSVGLPSMLRLEAERCVALAGLGSRFTDLALDALGSAGARAVARQLGQVSLAALCRATPAVLAPFYHEGRLHELAGDLFSHDVDRCFRYFVARDLPDFVGTGALPSVREARTLCDEVGRYCRDMARELPFNACEQQFRSSAEQEPSVGIELLTEPFGGLMQDALSALALEGNP